MCGGLGGLGELGDGLGVGSGVGIVLGAGGSAGCAGAGCGGGAGRTSASISTPPCSGRSEVSGACTVNCTGILLVPGNDLSSNTAESLMISLQVDGFQNNQPLYCVG